jgi:hypothetical protein
MHLHPWYTAYAHYCCVSQCWMWLVPARAVGQTAAVRTPASFDWRPWAASLAPSVPARQQDQSASTCLATQARRPTMDLAVMELEAQATRGALCRRWCWGTLCGDTVPTSRMCH